MHELKHDGWRVIARKSGASVRLWTRQAQDVTDWFSGIAAAVGRLPVGAALLDGEALVWREDGHSDFGALHSRAGAASAIMVAFDLIELRDVDLRRQPIEDRRGELDRILLLADNSTLVLSQAIEGDGPTIFEHACRLGTEGIVSKRRGSMYRSGRVDTWRKVKFEGYLRRRVIREL